MILKNFSSYEAVARLCHRPRWRGWCGVWVFDDDAVPGWAGPGVSWRGPAVRVGWWRSGGLGRGWLCAGFLAVVQPPGLAGFFGDGDIQFGLGGGGEVAVAGISGVEEGLADRVVD